MALDISDLLKSFRSQGDHLAARMIRAEDGRYFLQMRVTMGVLQMEMEGRPDGSRPFGRKSLLDYYRSVRTGRRKRSLPINWEEIDRELMQYYHRRVCLLAVGSVSQSQGLIDRAIDCFHRAVGDAEHNLAIIDFIREQCPDEDFVARHENARAFVLFHRTLGQVQSCLLAHAYDDAVEATKGGIRLIRRAAQLDSAETEPEGFDVTSLADADTEADDEEGEIERQPAAGTDIGETADDGEAPDVHQWIGQLEALMGQIRQHYHIPRTLREQIADAVNREDFEAAAELKRKLESRQRRRSK